jgi:hypothetical protein
MTKKENSHRQRISHDFGRARGFCWLLLRRRRCHGVPIERTFSDDGFLFHLFFSCRLGWEGELCTMCSPYPGCKHGYCVDQPWQCICNVNWGGILCDQGKAYFLLSIHRSLSLSTQSLRMQHPLAQNEPIIFYAPFTAARSVPDRPLNQLINIAV